MTDKSKTIYVDGNTTFIAGVIIALFFIVFSGIVCSHIATLNEKVSSLEDIVFKVGVYEKIKDEVR